MGATASTPAAGAASSPLPPSKQPSTRPDPPPPPPFRQPGARPLPGPAGPPPARGRDAAVNAKIDRALGPLFFCMTVLCYLDRTNLAYAALQLNERLGFSESVYARGASIFFLSYASAQIPSTIALQRVGPARWLPFLVIAWGVAAVAFAAMRTPTHFYFLRVCLGLAEAGVFPGLWVVLHRFYGPNDLGLAYARASLGTVVAQAVGAPLAAALLSLDGVFFGLAGWRVLFLAEGVPTLALGVLLARSLPDGPADARFLTPDERAFVAARTVKAVDKPHADVEKGGVKKAAAGAAPARSVWAGVAAAGAAPARSVWAGVAAAASNPRTFHTAAVVALEAAAKNAIIYWSPLVIAGAVLAQRSQQSATLSVETGAVLAQRSQQSATLSVETHTRRTLSSAAAAAPPSIGSGAPIVALLCAAPFGVAALAMWWCALHAKTARSAPRTHVAVPYAGAAAALLLTSTCMQPAPAIAFAGLLAAAAGLWAPSGVIYALPASFLGSGPAAAAGVALINSLGNVGGAVGPMLVGGLKARTGGHAAGLAVLAATTAAAAAGAALLPAPAPTPPVNVLASSASTGSLKGKRAGSRSASSSDEGSPVKQRAARRWWGGRG